KLLCHLFPYLFLLVLKNEGCQSSLISMESTTPTMTESIGIFSLPKAVLALLPLVTSTVSPTPALAISPATNAAFKSFVYFGFPTKSFSPFNFSSLLVAHTEPITSPMIILHSPHIVEFLIYACEHSH